MEPTDSSGWWFFGGQEKSLLVLAGTGAVTPAGAAVLLEGRRVYPFPTPLRVPGEFLGSVRAAASASSLSFMKVLLGIRQVGGFGVRWEFFGGRHGRELFSFSLIRRCCL